MNENVIIAKLLILIKNSQQLNELSEWTLLKPGTDPFQ